MPGLYNANTNRRAVEATCFMKRHVTLCRQ